MYVCICARVREHEVLDAIHCGARSAEAVSDVCGAGTGCGTCVDRIRDLIDDQPAADTLPAMSADRPAA